MIVSRSNIGRILFVSLLFANFAVNATGQEEVRAPQTILIDGESFMMGNELPRRSRMYHADEPQVQVTVPSFRVATNRVTALQFCAFLNSLNGSTNDSVTNLVYLGRIGVHDYSTILRYGDSVYAPKEGHEQSSANQITFLGAVQFCRWLSSITGKQYRLPSEAEWELAARRQGEKLGMCEGIVGEWCVNRWQPQPTASNLTDIAIYPDDMSSERSIRGQRKWMRRSVIPFPFSNNTMHDPYPWTRQHQYPFDVTDAAWYGFRVIESPNPSKDTPKLEKQDSDKEKANKGGEELDKQDDSGGDKQGGE